MNLSLQSASFSIENFLVLYYNGMQDLDTLESEFVSRAYTLQQLITITNTIHKHGVTKSMETLFGDSFSSSVSMEEEAEQAKKSVFKRIWETIKRWFIKFINWVKSIFTGYDAIVGKLNQLKNDVKSKKLTYPIEVYNTIAMIKMLRIKREEIISDLRHETAKAAAKDPNLAAVYMNRCREIRDAADKAFIEKAKEATVEISSESSLINVIDQHITWLRNNREYMKREQQSIEKLVLEEVGNGAAGAIASKAGKMLSAIGYKSELKVIIRCSLNLISSVKQAMNEK